MRFKEGAVRNWWTELWSIGEGAGRTYCGIARTPEGFALDVFRGDNCLSSTIHASWREAEHEASALKRRHRRRRSSPEAPSAWAPDGRGRELQISM